VNLDQKQDDAGDLVYSWENIDIVGEFEPTDGDPTYSDTATVRAMTPADQIVAWWRVVSDCRTQPQISYCAALARVSNRIDTEPIFQQKYPVGLPNMAEGSLSCLYLVNNTLSMGRFGDWLDRFLEASRSIAANTRQCRYRMTTAVLFYFYCN
jgi:hypothetical protein